MNLPAFKDSIKSVDTSSLVDKVEASLVELLQERKLKVGDVIPKEVELAEALGVSRTVVREALTRLRIMGLIESKKKERFCHYQLDEHEEGVAISLKRRTLKVLVHGKKRLSVLKDKKNRT